jgi:hypothetical protein
VVLAPTSNQARGGTVSERFCLIAARAVDPALLLPPSAGEAEALSRRRVRSRWLGVGDSGHPALTGGSDAKEGIRTSRQRSFERGASTEPARASKHRMHTFGEQQVSADLGRETSRRAKAGPVDPSRRTRLLIHATERKRVSRTDHHDDRRVDDAAGLAAGECGGSCIARSGPCLRLRAGICRWGVRVAPYVREQPRSTAAWASTSWLLCTRTGQSGRRRRHCCSCACWRREPGKFACLASLQSMHVTLGRGGLAPPG